MFAVFIETLVPLISVFIFMLGNGFFSTLLAYNMTLNGEPAFYIGAMLLQYPVGKLSDRIERRLVLIAIAAATIAVCVVINLHLTFEWLLFGWMMLFGGLTFALYPSSISHACDSLEQDDIVAGTQTLLLAYSIGAMMGPFLASVFIGYLGADGLFSYVAIVCLFTIPVFVYRRVTMVWPKSEEHFVSTMQTTPIMAEIDPRGESAEEREHNAAPEVDRVRPWDVS